MPGHNKPAGVQRMNIQALQLERQTLNSIDAKHCSPWPCTTSLIQLLFILLKDKFSLSVGNCRKAAGSILNTFLRGEKVIQLILYETKFTKLNSLIHATLTHKVETNYSFQILKMNLEHYSFKITYFFSNLNICWKQLGIQCLAYQLQHVGRN